MSGLGNGFINLFKYWGKGIGKAADNFWLGADAQKAIRDEVEKKFQPKIDIARRAESRRADNIKDLDAKLNQSKKDLQDAKDKWQQNYDAALAGAKAQRQTDINAYDTQLKAYQDAVNNAKAGRQSIVDQLYSREANYDPYKTLYTDVKTGNNFILNPISGEYENLTKAYKKLTSKQVQTIKNSIQGFETRLYDSSSGDVINAFDKSAMNQYAGNTIFNNYLNRVQAPQNIALRDADKQITRANNDLNAWKSNSRPQALNEKQFETDFEANNAQPTDYSFNGKTYTKEADLDKAYQDALTREQKMQSRDSGSASRYASKRDAEIAKRIQDAKDIKKAKLALGAGALAAGAAAMYGGDDTDNGDNTDNIDNTNNTYTGEPDPDINIENTPEGKAALKGKPLIDTDFDPDTAAAVAVLANGAYDQGVEDANSVRSSADLDNNIGATTRGHTMDDRLYELIKAMKDPYKADAVANYIYSRHGDDPEVQRLGWRGWLNKYYGDSLRSIMNIDPSGYKGMHVSGGL